MEGPDTGDTPRLGGFGRKFKTRLLTGLFITFPLFLTYISVAWLFDVLDGILGHLLERFTGRYVPVAGFVLLVLIIFTVGTFATTVFGKRLIDWVERMIMSLPVFKSFYSTFKQLGDAFSPQNKAAFKQFVIVEYPRAGAHAFGFLTKECMIKDAAGEQECYMVVYIPTNHLYLGDIALFKRDEVVMTDLSIEDGIKVILSAGIGAPNVIARGKDYPRPSGPIVVKDAGRPAA